MINLHYKTLIDIYISSRSYQLKDTALASIDKCVQLKRLLLSNVELTRSYDYIIGSLNRLEDLMIGYHSLTLDKDEFIDDCFFSEPKIQLKRLNIGGMMLYKQFFDSIFNKYVQLNVLIIPF